LLFVPDEFRDSDHRGINDRIFVLRRNKAKHMNRAEVNEE
jgi:hypothetical protein